MAEVDRPGDQPSATKAGTRLDPDYEQRLADEAETGFDPPTLTRRHFGRPPLSGGPATPRGSTCASTAAG